MPVPAKIEDRPGRMAIDGHFGIVADGRRDGPRSRSGSAKGFGAPKRSSFGGRRFATSSRRAASPAASTAAPSSTSARAGPAPQVPQLGDDESYVLEIREGLFAAGRFDGLLEAPTTVGALRGLETFLQLVEGDREGYFVRGVRIEDRPRFPWRGLLIDSARHFMPMEVMKRNLDGMAAVKLNVLHWHLTEDQGFRVESKRYPRLHEMGSDGEYYTQDQLREIIAYAAARGIRVVPEFDMPGHVTSWLVGHPGAGHAARPVPHRGQVGDLRPRVRSDEGGGLRRSSTAFLGEMAALFPDAYLAHRRRREQRQALGPERADRRPSSARRASPTTTRCRRTSTAAWPPSSPSTARRWWAGTRSSTPTCRRTSSSSPGRARSAGRGRAAGDRGHPLPRLLPRLHPHRRPALRRRPAARRHRSRRRPGRAHPRRRGLHVERIRQPGDHRLADLAADGRHRRALLVAARA